MFEQKEIQPDALCQVKEEPTKELSEWIITGLFHNASRKLTRACTYAPQLEKHLWIGAHLYKV